MQLAHPAAIKRYEGLKRSGDESDALQLAHLLRLGILHTGYICPLAQRRVRDLARRRMQLVRHRSMHVLSIENVQARETGSRMTSDRIKRLDAPSIAALGYAPEVQLSVEANLAVIHALGEQIHRLEKYIGERVRLSSDYQVLTTAPGIAKVLATTIMLETGTVERFPAVGHFASYARCVDSERLSNDRKKGEGNRRNGNKYLAWAFIEAANMARRWCPEARRFHDRKRAKTNAIVATKAASQRSGMASSQRL